MEEYNIGEICEELAAQVVPILKDKELIMCTAESCTGGLVASSIVSVPGASGIFHEGYITYSDQVKHKLLGVSENTLNVYKAVSSQTAQEMAIGGAKAAGADVCIAVTGVAGPDGEDGKPVGLVYIGCFYNNKTRVLEYNFSGNRQQIRWKSTQAALEMLKNTLLESYKTDAKYIRD